MNKEILIEWSRMPKVEINGRRYVDLETLKDLLNSEFLAEKKNCDNQSEQDGIDMCRNILVSLS